jgi:hypothetical protein
MTEILWDSGTIVVKGADPDILPDVCVWDDRHMSLRGGEFGLLPLFHDFLLDVAFFA